jgi:predicted DNA-binding transcriptional regulator YafY
LRLLDILMLARSGTGWTAGRLARKFGVSTRRIFEDLQVLGQCGQRPVHDGSGYRLLGNDVRLPVTLRVEEILALLRPRGDGPDHREAAQRKLAEALPPPLRKLFRDPRRVRSEVRATPVAPTVWAEVDGALSDRQVLRLRYRGNRDGEGREREVEPHVLFMEGTGWYLAAWCRRARGWRLFRMDRVIGAGATSERFVPRSDFRLDDYVSSDVGVWVGKALDAQVEILPSHVEAVRSEALARCLPFRRAANGALLEIPRGNLNEAAWWLARFGEGVRVLRPPELRSRLDALGRRIVELNGG